MKQSRRNQEKAAKAEESKRNGKPKKSRYAVKCEKQRTGKDD